MVVALFVKSYVSLFFALGQLLDLSRRDMAISFFASVILGAAATCSLKSFDNILVINDLSYHHLKSLLIAVFQNADCIQIVIISGNIEDSFHAKKMTGIPLLELI